VPDETPSPLAFATLDELLSEISSRVDCGIVAYAMPPANGAELGIVSCGAIGECNQLSHQLGIVSWINKEFDRRWSLTALHTEGIWTDDEEEYDDDDDEL